MVQRAYRKEDSQKRTAFLVVVLLLLEEVEVEFEAAPGGEKTFRNRQSSWPAEPHPGLCRQLLPQPCGVLFSVPSQQVWLPSLTPMITCTVHSILLCARAHLTCKHPRTRAHIHTDSTR